MSLGSKKRKKHAATEGVHTASATAEKRKCCIVKSGPHRVENILSKYVHAVYHSEALAELNNFYKRTLG